MQATKRARQASATLAQRVYLYMRSKYLLLYSINNRVIFVYCHLYRVVHQENDAALIVDR